MGGRKKNNKYEVKAWEHAPNSKSSHFVRLYSSMLNSPAWLALSNGAKLQYIVIKSQYKGGYQQTDGNGNAMVKCPYTSMNAAGIKSSESISENCRQLEAFGFVDIKGGGYHIASEYKFSNRWCDITEKDAQEIKSRLRADKKDRDKKAKEKSNRE